MEESKRQLGWKNYRLFIVLILVVGVVVGLFALSIILINQSNEVYEVAVNSTALDKDYKLIDVKNGGQVTRGLNGNYELSTVDSEGKKVKYDLGKNGVVFSDADYKFYVYGPSYLINNDTSVKKSEKYEEVSKSTPAFYKLDDRKYLLADKTLKSDEVDLDTDGYLIVELDKQGNATLVNDEVNFKTINPIIIKGSYYDFDVAREKLVVGDEVIDLTAVIGSTNEYNDPEDEIAVEEETETEQEPAPVTDPNAQLTTYYDRYFERIKNSFNSLYSSSSQTSGTVEALARKNNVALDLTRWTNITGVATTPSSITVNYQVFDPNNEYSQIFVIVSEYGSTSEMRYTMNKEYTSYTIRDLAPDHKYTVRYGYVLSKIADETQADVFVDNLVVVTPKPKTSINITRITTNKVYYVLKLDEAYEISQGVIRFFMDGVETASFEYNSSMAEEFSFVGSFDYSMLGQRVEVVMTDMGYNGVEMGGTISGVYINES